MATYAVYATVIGSKYLGEVEAESEEEAKEKGLALDSASISLCHRCIRECEDPHVDEVTVELA